MPQVLIKALVLGPRFRFKVLGKMIDLGSKAWKRSQIFVLSPGKVSRFMPQDIIKVLILVPRFRFQVLGNGPRFRSKGLEKVLDFCPQSRKGSQNYDLGPNKVPDFSSYVLEKVLDFARKAWKSSQISLLVPRKGPRFLSSVLEQVPRFITWVLIKVLILVPRSYEMVLDLGPKGWKRSQIFVLSPGKVPRFMTQVLIKFPILVPSSQKSPRFRSKDLENVKDVVPRS